MAVLEAILPRVEQKIDHQTRVAEINARDADAARKSMVESLDEVKKAIAARENQAKGVGWTWEIGRSAALFIAGIGGLKWFGFVK